MDWLFTDTELAEDPSQQVVGCLYTHNLTQGVVGPAQLFTAVPQLVVAAEDAPESPCLAATTIPSAPICCYQTDKPPAAADAAPQLANVPSLMRAPT